MEIFEKMKQSWKSEVVARTAIHEFTGGAVSRQTCANLDCKGEGIQGAFRIGSKVVYPVDSVIDFLKKRANINEEAMK